MAERKFAPCPVLRDRDSNACARLLRIGCEIEDDAVRALQCDERAKVLGENVAALLGDQNRAPRARVDVASLLFA